MIRQFVAFSLYAAALVNGDITYGVRPSSDTRRSNLRQPESRNAQETSEKAGWYLTYSEDGFNNTLPAFLLTLYEAPQLSSASELHVEKVLNNYILSEANDFILSEGGINMVYVVENTILSRSIVSKVADTQGGRLLQDKEIFGIELEMVMKVVFDYEPTPYTYESLVQLIQGIMTDLTDFVTQLRDTTLEDLQNVTEAFRTEKPERVQDDSSTADENGSGIQTPSTENSINSQEGMDNTDGSAIKMLPGLVVGATLVALATYFIFRRKRQAQVATPKGDMLYVDNDLYSMDRSLESDDPNALSPNADASIQSSMNGSSMDSRLRSPDAGMSPTESPYGNHIRHTKSLMSGLTETSATTIRVSNVNTKRPLSTPKSLSMAAHSSLFAFSEEAEDAFDDDISEKDSEDMGTPSLAKSDVSVNSNPDNLADNMRSPSGTTSETSSQLQGAAIEHPSSVLGRCNWYGRDAASPSDVLADLAEFASSRDPTPREASKDPSPRPVKSRDPSPRSKESPDPSPGTGLGSFALGCMPTMDSLPSSPTTSSVPPSLANSSSPSTAVSSRGIGSAISKSSSPLSSAKASQKPSGSVYSLSPSRPNAQGVSTVDRTPLIRNTEMARASGSPSQSSAKAGGSLRVECKTDGEEVETVGQMSGRAMRIIGGAFGVQGNSVVVDEETKGNQLRTSTIDAGSRPATPTRNTPSDRGSRPPTPNGGNGTNGASNRGRSLSSGGGSRERSSSIGVVNRGRSSSTGGKDRDRSSSRKRETRGRSSSRSTPTSPNGQSSGTPKGGGFLNAIFRVGNVLSRTPPGDSDYVENLSRPSTPGIDFNDSVAVSDYVSEYNTSPYGSKNNQGESTTTEEDHAAAAGAFPTLSAGKQRRHAGDNMGGDGSAMYQTNAMHPLDWSYKSADASIGDSTISEHDAGGIPRQFVFSPKRNQDRKVGNVNHASAAATALNSKSPMSYTSKESRGSAAGTSTISGSARTNGTSKTNSSSQASASRQLINDLVWLEKKIANVRGQKESSSTALTEAQKNDPPAVDTVDSLSYVSNDAFVSPSSNEADSPAVFSSKNDSVTSSIVCRDCYAPPGKLHIVIHSTKDGPSVHTVKEGSSLEGHIFPGDLIIAVDDVDTRSYTAEQVMKMMAAKSSHERKITVLHFDEE